MSNQFLSTLTEWKPQGDREPAVPQQAQVVGLIQDLPLRSFGRDQEVGRKRQKALKTNWVTRFAASVSLSGRSAWHTDPTHLSPQSSSHWAPAGSPACRSLWSVQTELPSWWWSPACRDDHRYLEPSVGDGGQSCTSLTEPLCLCVWQSAWPLTEVPTRMAVGGLTAVGGLAEPGRTEPLRLIGRPIPEGGRWLAMVRRIQISAKTNKTKTCWQTSQKKTIIKVGKHLRCVQHWAAPVAQQQQGLETTQSCRAEVNMFNYKRFLMSHNALGKHTIDYTHRKGWASPTTIWRELALACDSSS